MLPYKTILRIDKASRTPIYQQLSNEFIHHISAGVIPPGTKLPGTRFLSDVLGINRRTVIAGMDELLAQGWITVHPNKGCFVKDQLPETTPQPLAGSSERVDKDRVAFDLPEAPPLAFPASYDLRINDGYPDVRLAPLKELARNYSYITNSSMGSQLMTYRQKVLGDEILRNELVHYLSETRSIHVSADNIMTTRGSLMAFYVLFKTILTAENNQVVVGYPGFNEGYKAIKMAGGMLNFVEVDREGMSMDQVEALCQKKPVRAVFIIPHHHYPTTVSLSAQRRMELLALAEKYRFAIIEDDYDFDFHYASAPILPIASIDRQGSVAYVGSFSKTVAPSLRLGFIVAPRQLIAAASQVSKYVDSFGNTAMEHAVAMLFQEGAIRRHLRKALKTYRERRDHFCALLREHLEEHIDFSIPEGGLAVWAQLKQHDLKELKEKCAAHRIGIPDTSSYYANPYEENALRIGFASMTQEEAEVLIRSIAKALRS